MKIDYRLTVVGLITILGNAYVQYLVYHQINWTNAILIGLVLTAALPLLWKKK